MGQPAFELQASKATNPVWGRGTLYQGACSLQALTRRRDVACRQLQTTRQHEVERWRQMAEEKSQGLVDGWVFNLVIIVQHIYHVIGYIVGDVDESR